MNNRLTWLLLAIIFGAISFQTSAQVSRWQMLHHYGSVEGQNQSFLMADFDYRLESNHLTNQLLNEAVFQGEIGQGSSAYLLDAKDESQISLAGGVMGEMLYFLARSSGLNFVFQGGMSDVLTSKSASGLYKLFLLGNGLFEGETLSLGPSKFRYVSTQHVGFGIDKLHNQHRFGVTLNIQKVSRYQFLEIGSNSELYTAPYGEQLNLKIDASSKLAPTTQSKMGAWQGTGFVLNAYYVFRSSGGNSLFSIEINDLGALYFGGYSDQKVALDSTISGFEVSEILRGGLSTTGNSDLDSLEALLGQETKSLSGIRPSWSRFKLSSVNRLSDKLSLMISGSYTIGAPLPRLRAGLCIKPVKILSFEPYFIAGGFTRTNAGLALSIIPSTKFQLLIKYGMLNSTIAPTKSTSQQLSGLISFGL